MWVIREVKTRKMLTNCRCQTLIVFPALLSTIIQLPGRGIGSEALTAYIYMYIPVDGSRDFGETVLDFSWVLLRLLV